MTRADIFSQILSEASGKPKTEIADMLEDFRIRMGDRDKFDEQVSEAEAQKLLAALRGELPGIRAWLAQGNRRANAKKTKHP